MRSATIVIIGCALIALTAPNAALGAGAIRIDELKEIVKTVDAEADAWVKSRRSSATVSHRLRNIWYDQDSINPLKTVLSQQRQSPQDLFVMNRLLAPMLNAKPKVIAEALSMIHPIAEPIAVYKPLPTYTDAELKAMAPPTDSPQSVRTRASKLLAEKRKKELEVQKHNHQVRALRMLVYRLMVLARSRTEDPILLKALVEAEKKRDWMYADILEAIRAESRRMSPERGKVFYSALRAFWNELRAAEGSGRKTYVDQGSVEVIVESNSRFKTHSDIAKDRTLKVINQVATAARMPALKDPKAPRPKPKKKKRTSRRR